MVTYHLQHNSAEPTEDETTETRFRELCLKLGLARAYDLVVSFQTNTAPAISVIANIPVASGNRGTKRSQEEARPADGVAAKRHQKAQDGPELWDCPFHKAHPEAHPNCLKSGLGRISDVRLHVKRKHAPVYCPRCGQRFYKDNKIEELDAHVAERAAKDSKNPCQQKQFKPPPTVSREQWQSICDDAKNKAHYNKFDNKTIADERRWYQIHAICFPNGTKPESPYKECEHVRRTKLDIQSFTLQGGIDHEVSKFHGNLNINKAVLQQFGHSTLDSYRAYVEGGGEVATPVDDEPAHPKPAGAGSIDPQLLMLNHNSPLHVIDSSFFGEVMEEGDNA
ncbi:hypothetical protein B0T25DRAFT_220903 [Lasiosphaeria hispida]|uniref:C2H2-type domain-containing protein n=1 Tax=Lasiosphaeria hispida TaxID=260671 RepID=A0AAJ0HJB7_9PEZI|nr:hypothetical protein B0T25DRAFT_220903 [Lasiosphaeria hispida]